MTQTYTAEHSLGLSLDAWEVRNAPGYPIQMERRENPHLQPAGGRNLKEGHQGPRRPPRDDQARRAATAEGQLYPPDVDVALLEPKKPPPLDKTKRLLSRSSIIGQ